MKKTILDRGGAGFIGINIIDLLLTEEDNFTIIDNFDQFHYISLKRENIKGPIEHDSNWQCDVNIQDKEVLDEAIPNNTDVIEHLAPKAGVRLTYQDSIAYLEVNVAGSQKILKVARLNKNKKFILASSSSVYSKNPNLPWKRDNLELQLISPYDK